MSEMPQWPKKPTAADVTATGLMFNIRLVEMRREYERARADAAMARLRVAVAELLRHTGHHDCEDCWYSCATLTCDDRRKSDVCDCGAKCVQDIVAAIGPLPPEAK